MTTVTVLEDARARVAKGWCQHHYHHLGKHCAIGAIEAVAPYEDDDCGPASEAMAVLQSVVGNGDRVSVTDWNDTPGRTQAEVLAAFDRAIALAKAVQP